MSDPDITAGYHRGNPESVEADASISEQKGRLRRRVAGWIRDRGDIGATCEEVERGLDMAHQTASARITELKKTGELLVTDRRRPTGSGRNAAVYVTPLDGEDAAA